MHSLGRVCNEPTVRNHIGVEFCLCANFLHNYAGWTSKFHHRRLYMQRSNSFFPLHNSGITMGDPSNKLDNCSQFISPMKYWYQLSWLAKKISLCRNIFFIFLNDWLLWESKLHKAPGLSRGSIIMFQMCTDWHASHIAWRIPSDTKNNGIVWNLKHKRICKISNILNNM